MGFILNSLIKLIRAKNVLELGTYKGASTIFIAEAIKSNGSGKVYTIDLYDFASENIKNLDYPHILSLYVEMI